MIKRPVLKAHLQAHLIPGDGVLLLSEGGSKMLHGTVYELLVPLMDGSRDAEALVAALAGRVEAAMVYSALLSLAENGDIGESTPGIRPQEADSIPAAYLNQLLGNTGLVSALCLAAKLGIADLLKNGPLPITDLAAATGSHCRALYRMMRALASRGIFSEDTDGRFSLTALAEPLRSDAPHSVRERALFAAENLPTWGHLDYTVRTGRPAFEHLSGKGWFTYLDDRPALSKFFQDDLTRGSMSFGPAILSAHDFSHYRKIVDVGGGHGALLSLILDRNTTASGVLFEESRVIARTQGAIENHLARGRAKKVAGDFFAAVPGGGDAYVLKFVVHDWDDDRAVLILRNCRKAMAANGRVIIIEAVLPAGPGPSQAMFLDLWMLAFLPGRERTAAEYGALLQQAGLELVKVSPTASPFSIIEAVRGPG